MIVRASPASPLREAGSVYEVGFQEGLFISLGSRDGGAVGVFWPIGGVDSDKISNFIRKSKAQFEMVFSTAKLIGSPETIELATRAIHRESLKIEKSISRTGRIEIRYTPETGKILLKKSDKVRVLVVDDSKTVGSLLRKIIEKDENMEVLGTIEDPRRATEAIKTLRPDVITLDIHMPEMDGVTLLKSYLPSLPVPTVMISSISKEEGPIVMAALEAGAVDYLQKPSFEQLEEMSPLIREKIKDAAGSKVKCSKLKLSPGARLPEAAFDENLIVAIGSSTGGTEALREVFSMFPEKIPPVLVVQHIPAVFSKAFADRLNSINPFEVKEAEDGDEVRAGRILIAPGGCQMRIKKVDNRYKVIVDKGPPVNRHRPSVDVLFDSVAKEAGVNAVGAILTGMGADGAKGLLKMRQAGCHTIGQDEASSVVYGMPQAAYKLGAVAEVSPLREIAEKIFISLKRKKAAS